jgi:hypothetical protein
MLELRQRCAQIMISCTGRRYSNNGTVCSISNMKQRNISATNLYIYIFIIYIYFNCFIAQFIFRRTGRLLTQYALCTTLTETRHNHCNWVNLLCQHGFLTNKFLIAVAWKPSLHTHSELTFYPTEYRRTDFSISPHIYKTGELKAPYVLLICRIQFSSYLYF